MNRKELVDMIETGTSLVRNFLSESDPSPSRPSSYEDWNDTDVVGHIVGWMDYSIDKLTCLKLGTKQSDEYAQATSLDEINSAIYGKAKGKGREEMESEYLASLGGYLKAVSLYSNADIVLDSFDTGFKMELWRYMLMDTVIHPVQHVLYQLLKKKEFPRLVDAIKASRTIFARYSADDRGYALSEFGMGRPDFQERLDTLEKTYGGDGDARDFIQANRS